MLRKLIVLLITAVMVLGSAFSAYAAPEEGDSAQEQTQSGESAGAEGDSEDGESGGESSGGSEGEMMNATTADITTALPVQYIVIPAEGEQKELGYVEGTTILEADGLKFKDLNSNGSLDAYEDWRKTDGERIADLLSQMTVEEKSAMLFQADLPRVLGESEADGLETIWNYMVTYGATHFLNNNWSGTPDQMTHLHNNVQKIAEGMRLGIPATITSDRQYNVWAGYTDTAHDAFATANDVEMSYQLWKHNAAEAKAVGINVVLQPYGVEIGAWNGENPEYIAKMISAEVEALYSEDLYACVKHFITRGGDSSFSAARSKAENIENYLYCWQAAIDAGAQWIMTNGTGVGNLTIDYDPVSMSILRDTLGYDGVVITDWGAINTGASGILPDGTDLAQTNLVERYGLMISNGVDQIGINNLTLDESKAAGNCYWMPGMAQAVNEGLLSMERLDEACTRLLRTKFGQGLFENPYHDPAYALELAASAEYIAEPWEITTVEELNAARNSEVVELERLLQIESAVLVKNDNILPLSTDQKVYIDSTNTSALDQYRERIAQIAAVADTMDAADVVVADITQLNDAAELIVEDAVEAGK
ncbi:MAG: glycoside hydrolase family 3 protein, partial [Parasporobacterium sp.]|nr:glycoside hydrolase family 3 protein [Parasporobacterium sp.]